MKGSRNGLVPVSFQTKIIKRFMSDKELGKFIEEYREARFKGGVKKPNDVDKRLVKTFKELGSIAKAAETAKVSTSRVYSALSRVSFYEV